MKIGTLVIYSFRKSVKRELREKLRREFLGYNDKSNFGKYDYKRHGLLSRLPHVKLGKSLVIIKNEDKRKVVKILKKYNVTYTVRNILLNKSDSKAISV